ncbi:MAG: polysaccharide deacetylase family protein [Endomicrobium sp.]|jgi:peptidoglycan/xylan/chitin deacetylase (PgdA/CDA1 family)|nr:polysaccharide deacetylase family protein [Endomicrobium sp.]
MKKILFFIPIIILCISVSFAQDKIFYTNGPKDAKRAALSFDDGPGASTLATLDILKKKAVKATFFMLGDNVRKRPKFSKAVADGGHEIANHTYSHINFYQYKEEDRVSKIESELIKSQEEIFNAVSVKTYLVRYPYGYSGKDALDIAKKHNYKVVNWTFGADWNVSDSAENMKEQYLKALQPGAIFLMHDAPINAKELSFLEALIDEIIKQGYEIVTVGELLDAAAQDIDAQKREQKNP